MTVNFDQDIGELIKGFFNKDKSGSAGTNQSADSGSDDLLSNIMPFKFAIILLLIMLVVAFSYYKYSYTVKVADNAKKTKELERLVKLQEETMRLDKRILNLKDKLHDSREVFIDSLSHFGNSGDLGELYHSISVLATKYNLNILNIKEIASASKKTDDKKGKKGKVVKKNNNKPKVAEVKVAVEMKGSYAEYISFKEDLAVAEMLLKIDSENIKVKESEVGKIFVTLNLTTYAINKKPFQDALKNK